MISGGIEAQHIPVLRQEMLQFLAPQVSEIHVDGTFGCGGYTQAILKQGADVVAVDRDPEAIVRARYVAEAFPGHFQILRGSFGELAQLLDAIGIAKVDGIVLDLGVSSPQFDTAERGFSFRYDGPLDMRMSAEGMTVAEWLNQAEESEIADVLYVYGEERKARRIARAIVRRRGEAPLLRTQDLADLVRSVLGKTSDTHPATKTFMALRIFINDELTELRRVLAAAEKLLKPGGRLVVVTFHSLEDRIVKEFLSPKSKQPASRYRPALCVEQAVRWSLLTRKPVMPSEREVMGNPRARSAKLRAALRLEDAGTGVACV